MSASAASASRPGPIVAECFGGPLDGQRRPITYILPFIGGGLPAEVIVWSGHVYQLSVDRTRWEHRGEKKEKA